MFGLLTGFTKGAIVFPQIALGGDPEDYQYETILHVSSIMDEETRWRVTLISTGETEGEWWYSPWAYNGTPAGQFGNKFENNYTFAPPPRGSRRFVLTGGSEIAVGLLIIELVRHQEKTFNLREPIQQAIECNQPWAIDRSGGVVTDGYSRWRTTRLLEGDFER